MTEKIAREVIPIPIEEEIKRSYLDYAMSVIVGRALPDVRDGLKPVQRRILYSMFDLGNLPGRPYKKSARIVGNVIGRFHPHGDAAVYEALVRMAQPFTLRYPLVDGQGNFGSIDGDPPAAMRYCVTGDTLIATDRGLVPIAELGDPRGGVDQPIDLQVLALHGRVQRAGRWFDCGEHPTLAVRTRFGFEVVGTYNHPLLTLVPDGRGAPKLVWKRLDELREGDFVAIDRSRDLLWPERALDLTPLFPEAGRREAHELPRCLDEDLALILGALVAEGTLTATRIEWTQCPGAFAEAFLQAWKSCFPTCRVHLFERQAVGYGRRPFLQHQILAGQVIQFLNAIGLRLAASAEREVPWTIFRSPKGVVAAFLRAYFEGDGGVERSGRSLLRVSAHSKSEKLLKQVQLLLLRFGIVSAIRRSRESFRLLIVGQRDLKLFQQEIGFISPEKREALESFLPQEEPGEERYFFDSIVSIQPAGWRRVYSVRVESDCHAFWGNGFVNHNTEVRLAPIAQELLCDLEKETVDFRPNYDASEEEPQVLPAKLPNLLVNGASGIAVGLATNIPPHNLAEIVDGLVALIDDPSLPLGELMERIKGPDFPTGGQILGTSGIESAYRTGRGAVIVRGRVHLEEGKGGQKRLVITELPYEVKKARLLEKIAELVKEGRLSGIATVRDESDREGMRVVVELKRGENAEVVKNQLYQYTPLQTTFGCNFVVLVGGMPRTLGLKELLEAFLDHRREVVTRRTLFELRVARERAHLLEGLQVALANLDRVVAGIRAARTAEEARAFLQERLWPIDQELSPEARPEGLEPEFGLQEGGRYRLSPAQIRAILDLRLHRLTGLEREKIVQEYRQLLEEIGEKRAILESEARLMALIRQELLELKGRYGDRRRTEILKEEVEISEEDLVPPEEAVVTLTRAGYIKWQPLESYRAQKRGGRGKVATATKEEDFVEHLVLANTRDTLLFFTNLGRVYALKVYQLPSGGRGAKGKPLLNLLPLEEGERVSAILPLKEREGSGFFFFATRQGMVKKTPLEAFANIPSQGKIAIQLKEGDTLVDVALTDGRRDLLLFSSSGRGLRFSEEEVRPMGRTAAGVRGMKLREGDALVGMVVCPPDGEGELLIVTEGGYGKRVPISEFPRRHRGGQGVIAMRPDGKIGEVVRVLLVEEEDQVVLVTSGGTLVRIRVSEVPVLSRYARGVILIRLAEGEKVTSADRIAGED